MPSHFLAINHESYDLSTVHGVFDTFVEARDHLEALTAANAEGSPRNAVVEEWDGATYIATYDRWANPVLWERR
jgi:hypothetical protein